MTKKFKATATTKLQFRVAIASGTGFANLRQAGRGMDSDDSVKIQISNTCGGTFTTIAWFDKANTDGVLSNGFKTYTIDLGSYAADPGLVIAFRATNRSTTQYGSDGNYYFYIDDINIFNSPANDLTLEAIAGPTTICAATPTPQTVTVNIRNSGSATWNFSTNPVPVTVTSSLIRADNAYTVDPSVQTITSTINTGTLLAGASQVFNVGNVNLSRTTLSDVPDGQTVLSNDLRGFYLNGSISSGADAQSVNNTAGAANLVPPVATNSVEAIFRNATGTLYISGYMGGWISGTGNAPLPVIDSSDWRGSTTYNYTANTANDRSIKINLNRTSQKDWIISPAFLATANTVVTYTALATNQGVASSGGALAAGTTLTVLVSNDCGATWSAPIITHSNASNIIANTGSSFIANVPNTYAGKAIRIAFVATTGGTPSPVDVFLDNVIIKNRFPVDLSIAELQEPKGLTCQSASPVRLLIKKSRYCGNCELHG